jgi:cation diffusion facilitator CzcD-associated flavoprotein CzcO
MSIDTLEDEREVVRVAVIGVGSAGLGQLKQLVDAFNRPDVRATKRLVLVGYEARPDVGGIWWVVHVFGQRQ